LILPSFSIAENKFSLPEHPTLCLPARVARAPKPVDYNQKCHPDAELSSATGQCVCKPNFVQTGKDHLGRIICLQRIEPDFTGYAIELQKKIKDRWRIPLSSRFTHSGQRLIAVFGILPDGNLTDVCFQELSKNEKYNESAYRAILKSAPFAPFPKGYQGKSLDFQFIFETK
jgi:hypothetical protein